MLCLICIPAIGAALPAASQAARWDVDGKILAKSNETALVGYEVGKFTIVGVHRTEVACNVEYLDRLIGGSPGTAEFTFFNLYGCSDNTPSCTVESVSAKRLDYQSELSASGGKFFDLVKALAIDFKLKGASCSIAGSYALEENAEGEYDNAVATLVFPTTPLSGSNLVLNDLTTLTSYIARLEASLPFPGVEVVT
jgi:hypothetical protein